MKNEQAGGDEPFRLILSRSFEKDQGFVLGKSPKDQAFSGQWNLRIIFSQCAWKVIFLCRPRALQSFCDTTAFCCYPAWDWSLFFSQKNP